MAKKVEYLTVPQVAGKLRVSSGRVRQLIADKRIRVIRAGKRTCLIHPEELRRYQSVRPPMGRPRKQPQPVA